MKAIDVDSLLKDLNHDIEFLDDRLGEVGSASKLLRVIKEIIEKRPILDVEPVIHATWPAKSLEIYFTCSNCGNYVEKWDDDGRKQVYEFNYCPYCGAKMEFEELKDDMKKEWKDD